MSSIKDSDSEIDSNDEKEAIKMLRELKLDENYEKRSNPYPSPEDSEHTEHSRDSEKENAIEKLLLDGLGNILNEDEKQIAKSLLNEFKDDSVSDIFQDKFIKNMLESDLKFTEDDFKNINELEPANVKTQLEFFSAYLKKEKENLRKTYDEKNMLAIEEFIKIIDEVLEDAKNGKTERLNSQLFSLMEKLPVDLVVKINQQFLQKEVKTIFD